MKTLSRLTIAALVLFLLSGCSTPSQRIDASGAQFNRYSVVEKRLIRSGQIAVGFDEDQVRMALGEPSHIKSDTNSNGTRYIWEYHALQPDYNIFNSVSVSTRGGGVGAGIGVGGTPTRSKLTKRIVFERSNLRVSDFQSFE
jgi:outer membrane biogenesis lipoprotein LolB